MVSHMCIRNFKRLLNNFMQSVFDVLSLNTADMGDNFKRRKIFSYLKKSCSSKEIVFLQETHSSARNEEIWSNQLGCGKDSVVFSYRTSYSRDLLIALRESSNYRILSTNCNGRYIILNLKINNCPFILINYCASNDEC